MTTGDCVECVGGMMRDAVGTTTTDVNREKIAVPRAHHLACEKCGAVQYTSEQMGLVEVRAHLTYREKHHLLSPDDVVALREQAGLSQSAMATLLRLDIDTVSRWETDRNVQTTSQDLLLRVLRDDGAEHLRGRLENMTADAIEKHVSIEEWQVAGTQQALDDERPGILDEKMAAWMESLGPGKPLPMPKPTAGKKVRRR